MESDPRTADVYAGDIAAAHPSRTAVFSFVILADADPNAFARIANLFDLANLAPKSVHLESQSDDVLTVSVEIGPLATVRAEMIGRKIAQLTFVRDIQVRAKAASDASR
jgi:hypothetical protein